jgi:hypothetical protein
VEDRAWTTLERRRGNHFREPRGEHRLLNLGTQGQILSHVSLGT